MKVWKKSYNIKPWIFSDEFEKAIDLLSVIKYGKKYKGYLKIIKTNNNYYGKFNFIFNANLQTLIIESNLDYIKSKYSSYIIIELKKNLSKIKKTQVTLKRCDENINED